MTESQTKRRGHKQRQYRLWFTEHDDPIGKTDPHKRPFVEPFASFAKALVRLRHGIGGQSALNHMVFMRALRYLYEAIKPLGCTPVLLMREHFTQAERAVLKREAASSAYSVGIYLVEIARLLDENRLTRVRIEYKSSLRRPESKDRLSDTAAKRREKLMPKEAVLDVLTKLSNELEDPYDLIRLRVVELLVVGGFRLGEALTLPMDALVEEPVLNKQGTLSISQETGLLEVRVGLRYWPEKAGEPFVKWLPTTANELAKRAVSDLLKLCQKAREIATWLEANPRQVKLSQDFGPDHLLSMQEVGLLLGFGEGNERQQGVSGRQYVRTNEIPTVTEGQKMYVRAGDLAEQLAILRHKDGMLRLPNGKTQPLSKSLCVIFLNQFHSQKGTIPYIVRPIHEQHISDFLCGRGTGKSRVQSVFERYGYTAKESS